MNCSPPPPCKTRCFWEQQSSDRSSTSTPCVYVTFVDELSLLGPTTVSLVSTVNPEHPEERTYKIVRCPADGQAHAIAIADKYGLTYHTLKGRLAR